MNIKLLLYIIVVPIIIWIMAAMKLEHLFKQNQRMQIVLFYVFTSMGISYLVVNFIYEFYEVSSILS